LINWIYEVCGVDQLVWL